MKKLAIILCIGSIGLFACNKKGAQPAANNANIEGMWQMIAVTDLSSNITDSQPAGTESTYLTIIFTHDTDNNGIYWGQTPNNEISTSSYEADASGNLHIQNLNMTKVLDEPWFQEFADHIRSATNYDFDNSGNLRIYTDTKILVFKKLMVGEL